MTALPYETPLLAELQCVRCGYNLRTQSSNGTCPECGTPIADSLSAAAKTFLHPGAIALSLALIAFATLGRTLVIMIVPYFMRPIGSFDTYRLIITISFICFWLLGMTGFGILIVADWS